MSDTYLKDDDIEIVEETGNDDPVVVEDGDKRLGDNAEDNEDDIVNGDTDADRSAKNAKKRKKQKELRKRARTATAPPAERRSDAARAGD